MPNLAERAPCPATAGNEVGKIPRACFLQLASFNQKQVEDYLKAAILADFAGECELSHLQQIIYSGSSIFNCRQKNVLLFSTLYQQNTSVWPHTTLQSSTFQQTTQNYKPTLHLTGTSVKLVNRALL